MLLKANVQNRGKSGEIPGLCRNGDRFLEDARKRKSGRSLNDMFVPEQEVVLRFVVLSIFLSFPAIADDKIVVTATRGAASTADLPFSVSTVNGETWQASGGQAENALATIPGLNVSSNGGPGQTRFLRFRGANAEHTLVLVDGIPVNDPLSPSGTFNFGQIPVDDIERVEVIKGPQSVLYGSNAMGGVVQIFTRRETKALARIEGGSYGTVKANLSTMGFRAGFTESRGFSAADEREGNTERDGYRSWNLGGMKEFSLNDNFLMKLNAQYSDSKTDTDRNGGAGGDSRNTASKSSTFLIREENVILLPAEVEWTLAGSYSTFDRDDNTNGAPDFFKASQWKIENLLRKPFGSHALTAGIEYSEEAGRSSQIIGDRRFRAGALFLQDQLKLGEFHANLGARVDLHSEHEDAKTVRAGAGYWFVPEVFRAKASIGMGFKAPSLFQTYSSIGSPHLRPERSVGTDIGVEYLGEDWQSELTWFHNRFRDLIDFDNSRRTFFNVNRAESYGVEWSLERRFGLFRLGNALTGMRAFDSNTGQLLPRRPNWSDTVSFGYRKGDFVGAGLRARYIGLREDIHPALGTRQPMPAYLTLGADFFHHLGEGLRFVARGENLLDRRYQDVSGFGTAGLSGYAGIETEF